MTPPTTLTHHHAKGATVSRRSKRRHEPRRARTPKTQNHSSRRTPTVGRCEHCNKLLYQTRKEARQALHNLRRSPRTNADDAPMREYRCPSVDGAWHLGHHPRAVRDGDLSYQHWAATKGNIAKRDELDDRR